jgi:hypothetical protein
MPGFPKWNESTLKVLAGPTNKICTTCCDESGIGSLCGKPTYTLQFSGGTLAGTVIVQSPFSGLPSYPNCSNGIRCMLATGYGAGSDCDLYLGCAWGIEISGVFYYFGIGTMDSGYDFSPQYFVRVLVKNDDCDNLHYCQAGPFSDNAGMCGSCEDTEYSYSTVKWFPGSYPQWITETNYAVGALVMNNGNNYHCIDAHVSSSLNEPGIGGSWNSYWLLDSCPD